MKTQPRWGRVVLLRANGRYVRDYLATSKYNAKKIRDWLEDRYDSSYQIEIRPDRGRR